jgi:cystathionine beta-lyase
MKFGTKVIHAGINPDKSTGAIMTPVFQTSTFVHKSPGKHLGYEYSRIQNPTREALEKSLAALENGRYGLCFASGVAAIDAIIRLFEPGDEIIATSDIYGGSYRLFTKIFTPLGIKFHFVSMSDPEIIEPLINSKTKLIWIETPTNPTLNIIDIGKVAGIAGKHSVLLAVDNTFATPYLQRPLDLGADIVMHSVTKYLGGHSDVVMGAVVVRDNRLNDRLTFIQQACGAIPGPQDCFLVLRGIKTLHLRMKRHCENGEVIASFLQKHPAVDKVFWPGFESHPNHEVAVKQMDGYGGMISFTLKEDNKEAAFRVMDHFQLFSLAESLGGVESLCGHPATMSHASIPKKKREEIGIKDSLIRLSVGVEDVDDLIDDLRNALLR